MPRKSNKGTLQKLVAKLRSSVAQLSYLPRVFSLIWDASRNWTLAWGILLVLQGVLPAATVYLTRLLVNSLVAVIGAGMSWESIQTILVPVAIIAGVLL